ncbi:MAG TPA: hypothetical protein VL572_07125 [Pyrinomonadaceae bacterium]|nr:hypothetical protein [Pyrinomonadaceae bacterium]
MKHLSLLIVLTLIFAISSLAQNGMRDAPPAVPTGSVDLGGRSVRIPAPDNFTDTMVTLPRIAGRLVASESPLNEVLAVHVADEILPRLRNREDLDLPFYTKVSILKELKSIDVELSDFQALGSEFEKQSPGMLQSIVKSGEKDTGVRLGQHWGGETNLKIGETRTLGYFDKQPHSISSMFLMNLEIFDRPMLILGSMSLVHANKRLLFVYVFRITSSGKDRDLVAKFTKAWTSKIITAN